MKRFLTIIAATAVAAAVTIPAVADSGSPPEDAATFERCLRTQGVPVPAGLEGRAFKEWIGAHSDTAGLEDAFEACDAQAPKPSSPEPDELRTCLAGKGLEPPVGLDALKPWILEQSRTAAGEDALKACGFGGVEKKGTAGDGGSCGAEPARAKASRQQRPKARTTPAA
ncbi:hypothetical protein DVA67_033525 [Solirubrobacter sp. CPCC 204708]|uniref:Secreted protein n=1 Tax=Solirubrobacter deserti TaxID=2282478 RepID=A0ABT4RSV7_9ACTN|nr:hypothetical protein [Solirubrobacter deserti]MBE2320926.1 hypothetical protein [Solirubrobacter deserti]MDA0141678.1 hypothetical protein [Solirubrobacter deserti]